MRSIWKGAVAFGLVNVPVKLYAATGEHQVPLHQVHRSDGGRIRYRKVCSICGKEVEMADIAKGYEPTEGELVMLTDEDLAALPLSTSREIDVVEFVPSDQVDPVLLAKTYYLEPEKAAVKPYALLREALRATDRMAVVKVAMRQRESMAVLRVRDDVICLQTLLWPDEVREPAFDFRSEEVDLRPQELSMASSLVESLAADFDPEQFEDSYREAMESMIREKVESGSVTRRPEAAKDDEGGGEVIDLLSALERSVAKAKGGTGKAAATRSAPAPKTAKKKAAAPKKKAAAKRPAKKTTAKSTDRSRKAS